MKKLMLFEETKPVKLIYLIRRGQLDANGFSLSNVSLMGALRDIRQGWLLKVSHKLMELTAKKPLYMLQKLIILVYYFLLQYTLIGHHINGYRVLNGDLEEEVFMDSPLSFEEKIWGCK